MYQSQYRTQDRDHHPCPFCNHRGLQEDNQYNHKESPPRPLLKSGPRPENRYGTHQETISRRPEQMYTPFETGLE